MRTKPRRRRRHFRARGQVLREELEARVARQGGVCPYCKQRYSAPGHDERTRGWRPATIDHMMPLSRGGSDRPENRTACCLHCNKLKGPLTVEEFMLLRHDSHALKLRKEAIYHLLNETRGMAGRDRQERYPWLFSPKKTPFPASG